MNLIDLSIRRPVFAWMLMFSLIVFGAICASRIGVSQMPDVDFPIVNVSVNYDGAAPELVEGEILDPIEERLLAIEGIKEMRSSGRQGTGSVRLEFDIGRNVDVVLQEVQSALGRLKLPTNVDPPIISKVNPEEEPILWLSIYGDESLKEMLNWTDQFFLDQIRFLKDVGEVSIGGFSQRNLRIWIDARKLEKAYLTVQDVVEAMNQEHLEAAAGQFDQGQQELRVRWLGEASSVEQIANLPILKRGGVRIIDQQYRVKDVARVEDGLSDERRIARVQGKRAVVVGVKKQRGSNEVQVAERVLKKIDSIKDRFPKGFNYRVNIDFTRSAKATVHMTMEKLVIAALITIFVCFLFLGNLQAALNILFSIPTSIVGTAIILYFSGFTFNLFTLTGLTLAISIVVDDAIMLLENIVRHYRMGKPSWQAARDGAHEVLPAAIAATLAVVAVFLPVVFMDGIIGRFFFQFGLTMSAAVLLSLLEAVTITPMRAAALLSTEPKVSRFEKFLDVQFEKFSHVYKSVLQQALNWKFLILVSSTVFFVLSLFLIKKVRQEFVPSQDQDIVILSAQTPTGSSLAATSEAAKKIEEFLNQQENVEGYVVSIGSGGLSTASNQIFAPVALKPRSDRKEGHIEIMQKWRQTVSKWKDVRVTMRDISSRNLTTGRLNPVALNLLGPELSVLQEQSQKLIRFLEEKKLAVDLDTDFRTGLPEVVIVPNRQAMAERGVSAQAVGVLLAAGVGGYSQGRFTSGGKRFDIRFKMEEDQIKGLQDLKKVFVRNLVGNLIPLSELVTVQQKSAVQSISRINRQRAIAVFGNLASGQSQAAVLNEVKGFLKESLPKGYSYSLEGASAGFSEAFGSLTMALAIGILTAYMILAVQFNSFIQPIPVLIALPFSVSGALLALVAFDVSLNLFSFIGLIVLMGIAKKNSILLVEFTNHVREKISDQFKNASRKQKLQLVQQSLLEACPIRLRPILMTSVATVAAAIPLIMGSGFGAETRLPMGITIVGGTIVSTILTLFVTPALYLILSVFESTKKDFSEPQTR